VRGLCCRVAGRRHRIVRYFVGPPREGISSSSM
jgi:hypothetical protein